jgi:hypothetical protein
VNHHPADHPARSAGFDRANVAVGALVTAVLVILLGAGPMALIVTTPRDEGANIGGGILATLAVLLAVGLGSAFTALRAVRRAGDPLVEGSLAGTAGLVAVAVVFTLLLVVARGVSPWALEGVLSLAVPGLGAAVLGAALGVHLPRRSG